MTVPVNLKRPVTLRLLNEAPTIYGQQAKPRQHCRQTQAKGEYPHQSEGYAMVGDRRQQHHKGCRTRDDAARNTEG